MDPLFIGTVQAPNSPRPELERLGFKVIKTNEAGDAIYLISETQLGILNRWSLQGHSRAFSFTKFNSSALEDYREDLGSDLADDLAAKYLV